MADAAPKWGLGTAVAMAVCIITFILQAAMELPIYEYAMSFAAVVYDGQWYRIFSAAIFHLGILHIVMNMASLYMLGTSLESVHGTLYFAVSSFIQVIVIGGMYLLLAWLGSLVMRDPSVLYSSGAGYSGVLFAMAAQEACLSTVPRRSVFGLFSVPTRWYPVVLMLILQFALPNVSLLGHLAGLLVGFLHAFGALECLLPSVRHLKVLEEAGWFQPVRRLPAFRLAPEELPRPEGRLAGVSHAVESCTSCCRRARRALPSPTSSSARAPAPAPPGSSAAAPPGSASADSASSLSLGAWRAARAGYTPVPVHDAEQGSTAGVGRVPQNSRLLQQAAKSTQAKRTPRSDATV